MSLSQSKDRCNNPLIKYQFTVLSRCSSVASPVLVNTSAVLGLAMSLAYCLGDSESLIISSRVTSMSWQKWATFGGQLN